MKFSMGGGGIPGMGGMNFSNFSSFGGGSDEEGFSNASKRGRPQKQETVEYDVNCSLEEIYTGCTKKMKITKKVQESNGQIRQESKILEIKVKPGWKEGTAITFER